MARILLVEDDSSLARGLASLLRNEGYAVDVAVTAEEALEIEPDEPYHLLILDIGLPGIDGFEALRRLRLRGGTVPVLILTARDERGDRIRGLDLGADDYLGKPFDEQELLAHVRALIRRSLGQASPVITIGALTCDASSCSAMINGSPVDLRRREWAVLYALASRAGKVVGKDRLVAEVFGYDDPVGTNAVEVYITRLRKKLGPAGPAIRALRGLGYMMDLQ
ncbi:response regulator transcription factor [Novosphingobium sp. ERW19]|uniref:response regulator transcription factor n=1 Tax=Novosphingobium sp. ERW19 TaxID=2726186 RepID=UPI0014565178|nr:response regulator transcription factor [Novosphingobium sp. ERW19]NLR40550.1 response regulator transcription factor [Novosphingobium sp. ERW19]